MSSAPRIMRRYLVSPLRYSLIQCAAATNCFTKLSVSRVRQWRHMAGRATVYWTDRGGNKRKAFPQELFVEPIAQPGATLPKFEMYSYLDRARELHMWTARSKMARTVIMSVNTCIVLMGGFIALVGGLGLGMNGYPIVGGLFFIFIVLGAVVQRSAFDCKRVYGVWQGLCPYCSEPLSINAGKNQAKMDVCPLCSNRVMLKKGSFEKVPWYA